MTLAGWGAIAILSILGIIAWYYHQYFTLKKTMKHVKGPFPLPLLGSAMDIKGCTSFLPWVHDLLRKFGRIIFIMLGTTPMIVVADYEAMENVLSSNKLIDKSILYAYFHRWLNGGLLVSTGRKWKTRRRIMTPSYHFQILEQFVPIFNSVGNILVQQVKKEKNKDAVDVYPYITLSTLDVICETAMGVPINAQINKESAYVTSVKEMGRIVIERVFSPIQQFELTYKFTASYKREMECLRILHGHTDSVIKSRRQELEKSSNKTKHDEDDIGTKKRIAFLDMLLQATDENGQPLSDADIREEVDTFMFEGHDTTASGISFALYEIANNPDVQKKILEEQEEILQGEKRDFTYADLNQMKYLEMVIKETLRLYPSVPFYARYTTEEFQLTKDIIVPAGCTISAMAYHIQRDPEYFPEPNKFNPDRFSAANNMGKRPYSFVPFSAGPRNCIGQKFAILEMKTTLSKMVANFELSSTVPHHKLVLASETILKSDNGVIIKIKDRS